MMTALYGLVLLINRQLAGLVEVYFMFILPIPLVVYSAKYGLRNSLIVCASVLLLALMIALPETWFYIGTSLFVGVSYGSLVKRKAKNGVLLALTMLVSIASNVLTMLVFAAFFGYDPVEELALMQELLVQTMGSQVNVLPMELGSFLVVMLVLGTLLTGIMEGALVHMLSNLLLRRLKIEVRPFKPMTQWSVPKWTGYVAFIAFSLGILSSYVKINETGQLLLTVLMTLSAIYLLVFGYIAILLYGIVVWKRNVALLVILACLFLSVIAVPFLVVMGFLYITTELREQLLARRN